MPNYTSAPPLLYVEPPVVEPYLHGLFGAVKPFSPPDGHWLVGGVEWESLAQYVASLSRAGIYNAQGEGGTKSLQSGLGTTKALPFNVYAGVTCGSVGYTPEYAEQKAKTILELAGQHAAEASLWTGVGVADATGIAAPTLGALSTATTGGTVAAGTHGYRVSAYNLRGETLASTEATIVTTGATSTVTVPWTAIPGAIGYNVYGRTAAAELFIGTTSAVTFTDTGAATPAGALPAANTTTIGAAAALNGPTDGTTHQLVSGTATSLQLAVAKLEKWLGNNYNGRGYIHAPRDLGPLASMKHQIAQLDGPADQAGVDFTTALGTRWIFGGGYDGTGPSNAAPGTNQEWIYATGVVEMYRNDVELPVRYGESIDRATNQTFMLAEQQYITLIDGPIGAALVDLTL